MYVENTMRFLYTGILKSFFLILLLMLDLQQVEEMHAIKALLDQSQVRYDQIDDSTSHNHIFIEPGAKMVLLKVSAQPAPYFYQLKFAYIIKKVSKPVKAAGSSLPPQD